MRVGETRRLSIPASEGYGAAGFAEWNIPPNADLTFDVTVLSIA
jgi:FKBP-type peptidyl-prolyl cis-trans isomerase